MILRRLSFVCVCVCLFALAPTVSFAQGTLFTDAPDSAKALEGELPAQYTRSRLVLINARERPQVDSVPGQALLLNLFPDLTIPVYLEALYHHADGGYTWAGGVEGEPDGHVLISVLGDVTLINIHSDAYGEFHVRRLAKDVHQVLAVDPSALPECGTADAQRVPPSFVPAATVTKAGTSDPVLDMLVAYTTTARVAAGGTLDMVALINLTIAEANEAYTFSEVNATLNLVHTMEVAYDESVGFSATLNAVTFSQDPNMLAVRAARDAYGADAVSFIIDAGGLCGIGWQLQSLSGFSEYAYSVAALDCARSYYTFAHELGHNLGCAHDLANNPDSGLYSDSIGWHWGNSTNPGYDGSYRSIMAYSPGTRVPRFSNPNVAYGGEPTGSTDVADNAATLNISTVTAAGWRDTASWIAVVPWDSLYVYGPAGGPFSHMTVDFVLDNLSGSAANWMASTDQAWATFTASSGSLAAGDTDSATLTLSSALNGFAVGQYSTLLSFEDTTNGKTHEFELIVVVTGVPEGAQHFYDLSSDPGWSTQGDWAYGAPGGYPNPDAGISGTNVYGYNLTGNYPDNLGTEDGLTTTAIDCSNLENVSVAYFRWLGVEESIYDHAYVRVSNDGSNWTTVWENPDTTLAGGRWAYVNHDISAVADGQPAVYVRWVMGTTDVGLNFCGWNIDDIAIIGDAVPPPQTDLWVDFSYEGTPDGTQQHPYALLGDAVTALTGPYTITVAGADPAATTPETFAEGGAITTPMTLTAEGGTVRIGE